MISEIISVMYDHNFNGVFLKEIVRGRIMIPLGSTLVQEGHLSPGRDQNMNHKNCGKTQVYSDKERGLDITFY